MGEEKRAQLRGKCQRCGVPTVLKVGEPPVCGYCRTGTTRRVVDAPRETRDRPPMVRKG